jgi:hypothetical protein
MFFASAGWRVVALVIVSVVVGTSLNAAGVSEAFRWTAATGKVGLGIIRGP